MWSTQLVELDRIQSYNMKYDICTCNILRDIAHNEMIIKYVSQHCNWCFLSKSARSNFFLLLQSLFSKLNEHWISLKWSHHENREQKTKYKNIPNCSNTKRRTRIFKILNKALYVHHWGNICKFLLAENKHWNVKNGRFCGF